MVSQFPKMRREQEGNCHVILSYQGHHIAPQYGTTSEFEQSINPHGIMC